MAESTMDNDTGVAIVCINCLLPFPGSSVIPLLWFGSYDPPGGGGGGTGLRLVLVEPFLLGFLLG